MIKNEGEKTVFTVYCNNPACIGGRIETTMVKDEGYSNYTVMDSGKVAFKCTGCGKYAEADNAKDMENFDVVCDWCHTQEFTTHIQDVDSEMEPTHIQCKMCKRKWFQ